MHPLDPHGAHVHACAFGPRQRRHDAMRDVWCTLLRRAGWTVCSEQLVLTAPQASKRADLPATTPGGLAFALDLTFSAALDDAGPLALISTGSMLLRLPVMGSLPVQLFLRGRCSHLSRTVRIALSFPLMGFTSCTGPCLLLLAYVSTQLHMPVASWCPP